jgi:two-component system, cell cycle response regulator DivK
MPRIVLVEDTENNRVLICRRLRKHDVAAAEDAERGIEMVRADPPDLILMDVGLPGMDGYDATRLLKSDPATQAIPIIVLTAHAMAGDREKSLAAGADDYATKPIDFPELNEKIDALLAKPPAANE